MNEALKGALADIETKLMGRVSGIEKTIGEMATAKTAAGEKIVKHLLGAPSGTMIDENTGSPMACFGSIHPSRRKTLGKGFGEALVDMHKLKHQDMWGKNDSFDRIHGRLIEKGFGKMDANGAITKAALAEGTGATGGYTVAPVYQMDILRQIAEESPIRASCYNAPMSTRQMFWPVLDQTITPSGGQSAFYGNLKWTWQPEANNYQTNAETEPKFRQLDLVARDLVGITIASNQLLQDNGAALDTFLTTLIKEAMVWAYDYYILRGNGAAQPLGVLNAAAALTQAQDVDGHFTLTQAAGMMSKMLPHCYKNAVWLAHPSVLPDFITMTNGATNSPFLIWLNPVTNGDGGPASMNIPAYFFGRPLIITEKLPAASSTALGAVALVDFSKYIVGDRMAIQIEASPYPNFVTNQMTWRVVARWDGQNELSAAITLNDGTFQVSNIILAQF